MVDAPDLDQVGTARDRRPTSVKNANTEADQRPDDDRPDRRRLSSSTDGSIGDLLVDDSMVADPSSCRLVVRLCQGFGPWPETDTTDSLRCSSEDRNSCVRCWATPARTFPRRCGWHRTSSPHYKPTAYLADRVLVFGVPPDEIAVIVEVQRRFDEDKLHIWRSTWPVCGDATGAR
jgi:hypothetical protein